MQPLLDKVEFASTPEIVTLDDRIQDAGLLLAHLGVAVFITGVTLVKGYETEKDVRMQLGDTVEVGGYTFQLEGLSQAPGPNYEATRGAISVSKGGKKERTLYPEKRFYQVQQMPMTEAAIDTGLPP